MKKSPKKLTVEQLRSIIKTEMCALREAADAEGYDADAGEIVSALVDAFTARASSLRGTHGYTYDHQNGAGEYDHRPGERDKELGASWDSIVQLAVTDLVDRVTPIVEEIWQKLEDGEYGS